MPTHPHDHHDESAEHVGGWPYWHFIDIGTDLSKAVMKPATAALANAAEALGPAATAARAALPVAKLTLRALPVVGILGEAVHVYTPHQQATADFKAGKLSTLHYGELRIMYAAYVAAGIGGIFTAGAKEAITDSAQYYEWVDEKYIPHSLALELYHAGVIKGEFPRHDHAGLPHHHTGKGPCDICETLLSHLTPATIPSNPKDPHKKR